MACGRATTRDCGIAQAERVMLRLDSRAAIVWRDPFSLQFGVEPTRAVLREVSVAEERMIAALGAGVSRAGLAMIADQSGVGAKEVDSLLKRLGPVVLEAEPPQPAPRVSIAGHGPTVDRIAEVLARSGIRVAVGTLPDADCDLGIAVGHYVLEPSSYGFWLRRDLPHLPVVFGDDSVTIGPLVEPGTTACLYCLEHHRRDGDAAWSAIASQLWGRSARSETALAELEVASRVARLALRRLRGIPATVATSERIDTDSGDAIKRTWLPHPDCGCISLALPAIEGPASEDQRGIDSGSGRDLPRTIAVVGAPE